MSRKMQLCQQPIFIVQAGLREQDDGTSSRIDLRLKFKLFQYFNETKVHTYNVS